ncbi:MAG: hypothetical protein ABIH26_11225 [Candidatus Eisenbacteria bacterium]
MRGLFLLACVLSMSAAGAESQSGFWCWDADEILVFVEEDTVRIQHLSALYNCCPEPITYEVHAGDATIFVVEHTLSPCNCDCCANLEVLLTEVPAGPWNILFSWFDLERGEWVEEIRQVVVPDVGQGYEPVLAGQIYSGCLEATGVPEAAELGTTWGTVKSLFR